MSRPVHRDKARLFFRGLGTIAVLLLVALVGIRVQGGGGVPGKTYTSVTARFDNIGMLNPRHAVTRDGVRIGEVTETRYTPDGAEVEMRLDGDVDVFRDATAEVTNKSALGRKTVALEVGTPEAGPLGDEVIPESQTVDSTALDDALAPLDARTRELLSSTLRETGAGVLGHQDDLNQLVRSAPELLDGASEVSLVLADPETELPELLRAANRLAGRFQGKGDVIAALVKDLDRTLAAVATDGGGPLGATLEAAPATLRQARSGLDRLRRPLVDVRATVERMRGGLDSLARSEPAIRAFLRTSVSPLDRLPGVSRVATPAVQDLEGLLADARPLVPQVARALASADLLLAGLSPYATDIGGLAAAHPMLSGRLGPGQHYFSAMLVMPGLYTASLPDPLVTQVPYPAPGGGAWSDNPGRGR